MASSRPLARQADCVFCRVPCIWGHFRSEDVPPSRARSRCPPCKAFTPRLVQTFNAIKERAAGSDMEIVFVSWDKDQSQFDE